MRGGFEKDLEFDWDEANIDKNWLKHRVSNQECEDTFTDGQAFVTKDFKHSTKEARYQLLGKTSSGRFLTLYFTFRKNKIRVISGRNMTRKEEKQYEKI